MNAPMNNPMIFLLQAMRSGGNPNALLQQMANQNPQVKQVMQILGNKTPQQQRAMAENMARERGLTVEDIAKRLGISIPSNR